LGPPNKKQVGKIQRQKAELRASLWPELDQKRLWIYKETGGWLNIPRAMPLLLRIMDTMSKGKPVSAVYLDLWCRTFNDSFVIANKPREMAFYAGFNGERAERTWADRMAILVKLGFIETKEGPTGPMSYVLILNPFLVLKEHRAQGTIGQNAYNALLERLIETGTDELAEPAAEAAPEDAGTDVATAAAPALPPLTPSTAFAGWSPPSPPPAIPGEAPSAPPFQTDVSL